MATTRQIKEWLNAQVEAYKNSMVRLEVNDDLEIRNIGVQNNGIHLSSDSLRYIADNLEIDLYVRRRSDEEYPYELLFFYEGTVFFDIESEEQYQRNGVVG